MPAYGVAATGLPDTYSTGSGQTDSTVIDRGSKYPVYRIFFKTSDTPVDIMTSSVWALCRHKGFRAGLGAEKGYYQKAGHMTSLHFAGNRHPWNNIIVPNTYVCDGFWEDYFEWECKMVLANDSKYGKPLPEEIQCAQKKYMITQTANLSDWLIN